MMANVNTRYNLPNNHGDPAGNEFAWMATQHGDLLWDICAEPDNL